MHVQRHIQFLSRSLPCDFLSFFHSSLKMSKQFLIQGHADTAIGLIWSACNCQPGPDSRVKEHNSWKSQLPHYYIDGETESQRAQCPPVVRWAAKGFAWTLARSSLPVFWDNLLPSARTGASQGFPRAAAPVGVFSRGTTRISGSLSCGARVKDSELWDFPGGPVVRTPHCHCRAYQFDSWSGN